jgi:hypothetical protein
VRCGENTSTGAVVAAFDAEFEHERELYDSWDSGIGNWRRKACSRAGKIRLNRPKSNLLLQRSVGFALVALMFIRVFSVL